LTRLQRIASKTEIDTILARLSALSAEHFSRASENVSRVDVGTLGSYLEDLREVSNVAFHEGEHAAPSLMSRPPRPGSARRGSGW
jgi:hypothetical protein